MKYNEAINSFDYNPNTGKLYRNGRECTSKSKDGYLRLQFKNKPYFVHRIIWLIVEGYFPENDIDHINRDKADNRWSNLREVSRSCNTHNGKTYSTNTSGVRGVSFNRHRNVWLSYVTVDYKRSYLCRTHDFNEAAAHRKAAEQCLGLC